MFRLQYFITGLPLRELLLFVRIWRYGRIVSSLPFTLGEPICNLDRARGFLDQLPQCR